MGVWDRFVDGARDGLDAALIARARQAPRGLADRLGLETMSDSALTLELQRRRRARGAHADARPAGDEELSALQQTLRNRRRDVTPARALGRLEVPRAASRDELRAAYRRQVRQYHPDRFVDDPEKHASAVAVMVSLADALAVLLDARSR